MEAYRVTTMLTVYFYDGMTQGMCRPYCLDDAIKEANKRVLSGYNDVRVEDREGNIVYEPFKESSKRS